MENKQERICPILAIGGIANPKSVTSAPIGCWAEECEFWDNRNGECSLLRITEGGGIYGD